ncbi:MAG: 2-oxo-tetronate isomerase [Dongiaceae bacterium]
MPKFAANLSWLFQELPFLDRFGAAAKAGFCGVEVLFPYDTPAARLADQLSRHGLRQVLINAPPGDLSAGDHGLAALPGREAEFAKSLEAALTYATALDCPRIHVMAGGVLAGRSLDQQEETYVANLRRGAEAARRHSKTLLIEPLNRRDAPGYFLSTLEQARRVVELVDRDNVRLQFDLYHAQIMGGDLAERLRLFMPVTGHVQIAGVPGRHEPDQGEISYPYLFVLLDELGYDGWVGCEYRPRGATVAGLAWATPYGIG